MSTPEPAAGAPRVTRNSPPKRVRLHDGVTARFNEEDFSAGDELVVEGPVAIEWELNGIASIIEDVPDALDYEHADDHGVETDVTRQRQNLGQQHTATGTQASEEDFA